MPPTLEESEVKKVTNRLDEIKQYIHEKDLSDFINYIETAISEDQFGLEPIQFAAAMLMQEIKKESESQDKGLDITEDFSKKSRRRTTQEGYVRLFVNLGHMDNLEKRDLIDMFSQELGISQKDVQNVDVLNTFSFLEIPQAKQEDAIKAFDGQFINDRRIAIEVSDPSNEGKGEKRPRKPRSESSFRERPSRTEGRSYVRKPRAEGEQREFRPRNEEVVREIKHRLNENEFEHHDRPARKPRTENASWDRKPRTEEPRGDRGFKTGRPSREEFTSSRNSERPARKSRTMMDYSFGTDSRQGRSDRGERTGGARGHFENRKMRTR
jgi:hypothetical protein